MLVFEAATESESKNKLYWYCRERHFTFIGTYEGEGKYPRIREQKETPYRGAHLHYCGDSYVNLSLDFNGHYDYERPMNIIYQDVIDWLQHQTCVKSPSSSASCFLDITMFNLEDDDTKGNSLLKDLLGMVLKISKLGKNNYQL